MRPLIDSECKWRSIPGYEGFYEVSETGLVKSIDRTREVLHRGLKPSVRKYKGRLLSPALDGVGYFKVCLHGANDKTYMSVHRLVAEAFLGIPLEHLEVNHINGEKTDNFVTNLEWVTRQQNILHCHKVLKKNVGVSRPNARLSNKLVKELWDKICQPMSLTEISKIYGVNVKTLWSIKNGYTWAWLTHAER